MLRVITFKQAIDPSIETACAISDIDYGLYSNSFDDPQKLVHVEVGLSQELRYGDCYQISKVVPIIDKINNNSSFKYRTYMKSKRIVYSAQGTDLIGSQNGLLIKLKNLRLDLLQSNVDKLGANGPYVNAILLGDNQINSYYRTLYGQVGIAALFAISGMHIAIIYGVLLYYLSKLRVIDTTANKIAIAVLIIYSILAGSSVAINRALMMIGLKLAFKMRARSSVLTSCIISILCNPFNLLNRGYILSYVITYAIILIAASNHQHKPFAILRFGYLLYLIGLPFSYSFNYTFNLLSPIAMILITPVITFGLMPLSFILTVFPNQVASLVTTGLVGVINQLAIFFDLFTITSGHISLISWGFYGFCLYLLFSHHQSGFAIGLLAVWFGLIALDINFYPQVTFIDVGQGDGALVEYQGYNIMVDVGQKSKEVWKELRYQGVSQLDAVFISHAHVDHYGALEEIANYVKIDRVYELKDNQIISNSIGLEQYYSDDVLEVIPYNGSDENNRELIVRLNFGSTSFLFPGDIEAEAENYLVANFCQQIDSDIIKVPHHGSKSSSSQQFLDCVSPDYAIISSGQGNRYGHPNQQVVDRYQHSSIVYDTQFDGEITVTVKPNRLLIRKKVR